MYSKIKRTIILVIFTAIFLINTNFKHPQNETESKKEDFLKHEGDHPQSSGFWKLSNIEIDGDATGVDAHNWTWFEEQDWYGGGEGNWTHPYIIENITFDGETKNAFTIKDSSVYFIIRNCTFENSTGTGYALTLENVNNGTITNCSVFNAGTGIFLSNSNNNTIKKNNISDITNYSGIRITSNSDLNNITENRIWDISNAFGIRIYTSCTNNSLSKNEISSCSEGGIYIHSNNENLVEQNVIYENFIGILLGSGGSQEVISNTIFNNTSGIELDNSNNNILTDNIINSSEEYGIYISQSENCTCLNNELNENGIVFSSDTLKRLSSHNISQSNIVNGKTLYYYKNQTNLMQNNFSKAGQIFLVNCNNSIISDQNVSENSRGIAVYYSRNISILNCFLSNNSRSGILLFQNENCTLKNNTGGFSYFQTISLVECNNITLKDNHISYNDFYGIYLTRSGNCSLIQNEITNCRYGIYLRESDNNTLYNNTSLKNEEYGVLSYNCGTIGEYNKIINNTLTLNGKHGIYLEQCKYSKIIENCLINNQQNGIFIQNSDEILVRKNLIANNSEEGVYISDSPRNTIIANNFTNNNIFFFDDFDDMVSNTIDNSNWINDKKLYCYTNKTNLETSDFTDAGAIILINCNNSLIEDLTSSNTTRGISLFFSNNNTIKNTTTFHQKNGIYIRFSNFNNISDNQLYKNEKGINFYYSSNCYISKNNISQNLEYGIYSLVSTYNNITKNNISKNLICGIYNDGITGYNITKNRIENNTLGINFDSGSSDSILYENYFYNNDGHVDDAGTNNKWDNDLIGNFWDNYTGKDTNDDGIGDSPYNVPGSALKIDNNPIWWDAPVINITLPILNKEFGLNPPTYSVNILEGVNDTIWYTILGTGLNIYITESTGEIKDDLWELAPNGALTLRFYSNDSKGYIGYDDIIIFKNVETTSDGETNDSSPSDEFDPTPLIFLLILIAGVAVFGILMIRSRSKKEIEAKEAEIKSLKEQREEITEGDILISKEQHICLVHKGTIKGMSYICPDCGAYYCVKCYNALKDAENECWSCGAPLDEEKAKKKSALRKKKELVKEREEDSEIFETIEEVDTTHKSPQKSQKDIPREDSSDDTTPSAPEKQIEKEKLTIKAQSIQKEEKQIKKLKEPDIPAIDKKGTAIKKFEEYIHKMKKMANDLEDKITNDEITQEEYIQKRTVLAEKMGEATAKLEKLKESESN
ncbi:MAG: hypothetical protein EU521_00640 [Promethearchaeota archaeon]|nr:MAG: hypothetical protein EU521_00640 [Candidatus Lokiarchaeota archaeon]